MKTKIRSWLWLVLVGLLLTSCRVVVNTDVKADGSGELRTAVVFTAKEKEEFAQKPENQSKSICDGIKQGVPAGATFVEEIRDEETFCVTERPFKDLAELRQYYASMNQVKVNTLMFEMGKFTMDVDVDLTDKGNGKGLENEWHLTLPGGIGEHNAERVEGQTLVWVVSPGETAHLHAESMVGTTPVSPDTTFNNTLILVVVVLVLVLLAGGILAFILLRRKSRQV